MKNSSLNNQLSFEKQKELLTPYIENQKTIMYNSKMVKLLNFCEYKVNNKDFCFCILQIMNDNKSSLNITIPIFEIFEICYPHLV